MIRIKISKNSSEVPSKLSVFDFDGTLFKSPDKPKNYKGNWWIEEKSLSPKIIGAIPVDSMWNMSVVRDALQELSEKNTFCVLMTGRIGNVFSQRITELVEQKQLNFKEIKFNSFGQDAGEFKVKEINKLLEKYPSIKKIEMWEDEQDKIKLYTEEFASKYNFYINRI